MTQDYFGTKHILATPMNRQDYNNYRGWDLPADEDGSDEGFLIEEVGSGANNHPDHAGYISWSPTAVFEANYQPSSAMNFGHALEAMKDGHKVARPGWNGKGMWIRIVDHYAPNGQFRIVEEPGMDGTLIAHPYIKNANGSMIPWHPSIGDMMADDWCIVPDQAAEV